jgi:para-nitrobenzyl esterase
MPIAAAVLGLVGLLLASCTMASSSPAQSADGPAAPAAHPTADPATVVTLEGELHGIDDGQVRRFLGVPFAQPPTGDLRFTMPRRASPWTGVRDATRSGPLCAQIGPDTSRPAGSEDCLYLNVYVPSKPANVTSGGAPVMVWLHGGGFTLGSPDFTDGTQLANLYGVIVVAPAYRLGPLGFAGLDALAAEDEHHSTGSYGLADQQMALQWVHDNAAAFGGDAANVTLVGESAGGWSVCAHMVSPRSAGLFDKAIVESGPCTMPMNTPARSEQQGVQLANALGCVTPATTSAGTDDADLACLRGKPVEQVLAALPDDGPFGLHGGTRWGPTVDGWMLVKPIDEAMRSGDAANVPLLIGWNTDEGRLFNGLAYLMPFRPVNQATYHDAFRTLTSGDEATAAVIQDHYPLDSFDNGNKAFSQVLGDAALKCPARAVAVTLAAQKRTVFVYSFAYGRAPFTIPIDTPADRDGAFHSAEVQYVFDQPLAIDDPVDRRLALDLSARWARFAKTGDPNGAPYADTPKWPKFTGSDDPAKPGANMVFDEQLSIGSGLDQTTCTMWDYLNYAWAKR